MAVESCRVCASPRPDKHPGNENNDVGDDVQQEPAPARPLMAAGENRQCIRSQPCLPMKRVAWLSGHCDAANGFGHKENLSVRVCTGDCRKQPGFGEKCSHCSEISVPYRTIPPICWGGLYGTVSLRHKLRNVWRRLCGGAPFPKVSLISPPPTSQINVGYGVVVERRICCSCDR